MLGTSGKGQLPKDAPGGVAFWDQGEEVWYCHYDDALHIGDGRHGG